MLTGKAILNLQKLVRSVPVGDYELSYEDMSPLLQPATSTSATTAASWMR